MPPPIDPQAFLNLCEMAIDNTYELEALGELLEQRGLLTKQEIIEKARLLRSTLKPKKNPLP